MKAIICEKYGGPEVLKLSNLPKPKPNDGETLIAVKAAGVNPVDWKIREGLLEGRLPCEFPITMGWDAAGVVEKVGSEVKELKEGDEVFAYTRTEKIHDGSYAEYIVLTPQHLALKPKNLSFEEAAAVPLACLTAFQALFESIQLQNNETVLIHAGAGGVGAYAIQLAKDIGARVLTTASSNHHAYVRELGADLVIDYNTQDFCEVLRQNFPEGIDALFDTVGGETQIKSTKVLKKGGRLTSILAIQEEVQKNPDIKVGYVFVRPDSEQLTKIKELIEADKLKVHLEAIFPLEEATKAHQLIERGHAGGKIVLRI